MLETAIIGGGLCGLSLALGLEAQGRAFAIFEARDRLGGRVLSLHNDKAQMRVDVGPTWYWPETQPAMTRLVAELGLLSFFQLDGGTSLKLHDHDRSPAKSEGETVHEGARRIEGGMTSIIEALSAKLPKDSVFFDHVLTAVFDQGDHVELHFRQGDTLTKIKAKRAVLAMPPRLIEERVRFEPELDAQLVEAMQGTYTWMASEAKAVLGYDKPVWREAGQSGNAFVTHGQAVFGQIWDSCDATGTRAALAGFIALPPALRQSFAAGLPMLIGNQISQVFGHELEHGEQTYHNWAAEEFTCARRDLEPPAEHPAYNNPFLRQVLWSGKLFFGGTETASTAGGYLEGALDSARRLVRDVGRFAPINVPTQMPGGKDMISNADSVLDFAQWVAERQNGLIETYKKHLTKIMSSPDKEILTQRAMVATIEQTFSEALYRLENLPFDLRAVGVDKGRSALTPEILKSFDGFIQFMIDAVINYNRTSCALSNFPGEDKPSKDYMQAILRDIAAAWKEFCLSVNAFFIAKTPALAS